MQTMFRAGVLFVLIGGGAAMAHSGATGVVKQRMEAMMDVAAGMKSIGAMLKGQSTFNADAVAETASRLAEHASRIELLFPEGTNAAPSEAKADIWEDWDRFTDISRRMKKRASELAEAAAAAEQAREIRDAFTGLGKTCKTCHAAFREKK